MMTDISKSRIKLNVNRSVDVLSTMCTKHDVLILDIWIISYSG